MAEWNRPKINVMCLNQNYQGILIINSHQFNLI